MADPAVKAAIAACKQSGETDCETHAVPGEPRDQFSREEHERVHVFIILGDVEPQRSYEIQLRWFGPDGGMAARFTRRAITPSLAARGFTVTADYWLETKAMRPGRWKAEIAVNGEVEAERTFDLVGAARV